ncbi:hypothetical protein BpHYR1_021586 [Brachionus plicatilis]|uniref:Uncharacterized protein n=1 Tax=Brachionus plicatilis TaxID=10195 RepID=A0A3M7SUM8_BRAPC|nr:hypothetical protein BpHYR1_021586 [Brachionus plicatilis]
MNEFVGHVLIWNSTLRLEEKIFLIDPRFGKLFGKIEKKISKSKNLKKFHSRKFFYFEIFIFSLKNKSISSYICIICISKIKAFFILNNHFDFLPILFRSEFFFENLFFRNSLILLCYTSISNNLAGEHLTFLNKNAWSNRYGIISFLNYIFFNRQLSLHCFIFGFGYTTDIT